MPLESPGLWIDIRLPRPSRRSPALFVDRDGTLTRDHGYVADPAQVELIGEMLPALRQATRLDLPIVIVTNQSGIARGYFDWAAFEAVNAELIAQLDRQGCHVTATLACAYYPSADPALNVADHPLRKPSPGMLLKAAELLDLELSASLMVGDKSSDLEAGARAGLRLGFLVGEEQVRELPPSFAWHRLRDPVQWGALEGAVTAAAQHR